MGLCSETSRSQKDTDTIYFRPINRYTDTVDSMSTVCRGVYRTIRIFKSVGFAIVHGHKLAESLSPQLNWKIKVHYWVTHYFLTSVHSFCSSGHKPPQKMKVSWSLLGLSLLYLSTECLLPPTKEELSRKCVLDFKKKLCRHVVNNHRTVIKPLLLFGRDFSAWWKVPG